MNVAREPDHKTILTTNFTKTSTFVQTRGIFYFGISNLAIHKWIDTLNEIPQAV